MRTHVFNLNVFIGSTRLIIVKFNLTYGFKLFHYQLRKRTLIGSEKQNFKTFNLLFIYFF